ncbi:MAG: DsrE/DsrF/DrsH-like family protein [Proteobacteria bacterium]|nr:DsrE/DsrF/DrsH-like family protein [Pseudomonadota bacterium]
MTKKLVVILANANPHSDDAIGAPIFQASVAAAMGYQVEVICTGVTAEILKQGVAEALHVKAADPRSIYDFIKEAHAAGVRFHCFSTGLDACALRKEDLIAECSGVIGAAHFVEEIMEGDCRVLTY